MKKKIDNATETAVENIDEQKREENVLEEIKPLTKEKHKEIEIKNLKGQKICVATVLDGLYKQFDILPYEKIKILENDYKNLMKFFAPFIDNNILKVN